MQYVGHLDLHKSWERSFRSSQKCCAAPASQRQRRSLTGSCTGPGERSGCFPRLHGISLRPWSRQSGSGDPATVPDRPCHGWTCVPCAASGSSPTSAAATRWSPACCSSRCTGDCARPPAATCRDGLCCWGSGGDDRLARSRIPDLGLPARLRGTGRDHVLQLPAPGRRLQEVRLAAKECGDLKNIHIQRCTDGLFFGITRRSATGQFGEDGRPTLGSGIELDQ